MPEFRAFAEVLKRDGFVELTLRRRVALRARTALSAAARAALALTGVWRP